MRRLLTSLQRFFAAVGRCGALWTLLAAAACLPQTIAHAEPTANEITKEYQIKAAFVYNIAKFVEWPASSFGGSTDPIVIAVFGKNPLGDELSTIARERKINGRSIVVKQVNTIDEIKSAHLLFVGAADDKQFAADKILLQNTPLLTVGESTNFSTAGGIINFVLIDDKVRFEINIASAERAGLKISAQLQKLASRIRRTP